MDYPKNCKYSKEHEWVDTTDKSVATVGVTQYAIEALGDIVFVELPAVGDSVEQFGKMGEIESVKSVSDLYSPVGGTVIAVNEDLKNDQEKINDDPFGEGWLIKVSYEDEAQMDSLMDVDSYLKFISEL